jgi:hypothetical protein
VRREIATAFLRSRLAMTTSASLRGAARRSNLVADGKAFFVRHEIATAFLRSRLAMTTAGLIARSGATKESRRER